MRRTRLSACPAKPIEQMTFKGRWEYACLYCGNLLLLRPGGDRGRRTTLQKLWAKDILAPWEGDYEMTVISLMQQTILTNRIRKTWLCRLRFLLIKAVCSADCPSCPYRCLQRAGKYQWARERWAERGISIPPESTKRK